MLAHAHVALVAALGVLFASLEEFGSLCGELLFECLEAHFAREEVLEILPLRRLAVEQEGVFALFFELGVVAPEVPVATFHGQFLFVLRFAHAGFQSVGDTGRIGHDERRSGVGFCLADGLERLVVVGPHGDLRHVNVTISGGDEAEVLLSDALTAGGKLGHGTRRRSLGGLAAGVGVNFGVEDENVHIFAAGDHVVQSAVANVVGSAVTTDDPLRTLGEIVAEFVELCANRATFGLTGLDERFETGGGRLALGRFVLAVEPLLCGFLEFCAHMLIVEATREDFGDAGAHFLVGQGHTESVFAEVFEKRVGPCRSVSLFVGGVGGGGDGSGVDGGAAGGVGHHLAVAEELADEFHIGCLAAACTCAREFEERGGKLRVLGVGVDVEQVMFALDVVNEVIPVGRFVAFLFEGGHGEGFSGFGLAGAHVYAVGATGAVEYAHLDAEVHALHGGGRLHLDGGRVETGLFVGVEHEGTDATVGANVGALVTLDAVLQIPSGHERGDAALLVGSGALVPGTVFESLESADGEVVSDLCIDDAHEIFDESGCSVVDGLVIFERSPCGIDGELVILASAIDGSVVFLHHVLTFLAVSLFDEVLHLLYGLVYGDHAGDTEEGALQNGVGAVAQSDFGSDFRGVDHIDRDVFLCQDALDLVGHVAGEGLVVPNGVEQEGSSGLNAAQHVVHVHVALHVAGHEVGGVHQIGGTNGVIAETQVRASEAARLLRVVREVSLAILVGGFADDLDGVLVGSHRTVGSESVEFGLEHALSAEADFLFRGEGGEGHVVDNADGEVVLGFVEREVLIDRHDLCRSGVVGSESVASAHDEGGIFTAVVGILDVEIEGFSAGSGFFGAVEHGNARGRGGHSGEEVLDREGAIEVHADHADLFSLFAEVVDGFASSFGGRTHENDHAVGFGIAVVVEQAVFATGDAADFLHVLLHRFGHCLIEGVGCLAVCEEGFGVFGRASCYGVLGREGTFAEFAQRLAVHQRAEVFGVEAFDLLDLVRGAETVEEVDERHAGLDGSQVGHAGQVHHFLHRTFGEHGKAGLACRHDVLVIAEDAQGVAGNGARRNVEHAGEEFAGNLVHVRNHEQEALRCGESGGQCAGLERTVHSAGGAALALHFLHEDSFAEHVFAALRRPVVDVFCHRRRGRDGVNGGHFAEHISDVGSSLVAITSNEFLCHTSMVL